MTLINFSFEHTPQYVFFYAILAVFLLVDIQILPIYINLNLLMVFSLTAIYYWSIYNPALTPPWLLFLLGLLKDLATGLPLIGLSSIIFILTYLIVKQQRIFLSGQSFFMIWAGYMLLTIFNCFLFWLFLCLYLFEFAPYREFLIEGAVMILSFPIILSLLSGLHKLLPFAPADKAPL